MSESNAPDVVKALAKVAESNDIDPEQDVPPALRLAAFGSEVAKALAKAAESNDIDPEELAKSFVTALGESGAGVAEATADALGSSWSAKPVELDLQAALRFSARMVHAAVVRATASIDGFDKMPPEEQETMLDENAVEILRLAAAQDPEGAMAYDGLQALASEPEPDDDDG